MRVRARACLVPPGVALVGSTATGVPPLPATSNDVAWVVSHAPNGAGFGVSWCCDLAGVGFRFRAPGMARFRCLGRFGVSFLRCSSFSRFPWPTRGRGVVWGVFRGPSRRRGCAGGLLYSKVGLCPLLLLFWDRGMAICAPYAVPHPFLRLICPPGGRTHRTTPVAFLSAADGRSGVARARSVCARGLVACGPLWLNSQRTDCISCVQ